MFLDYDTISTKPPAALIAIERDTEKLGFDMPSVRETGALLRHLAALKPDVDTPTAEARGSVNNEFLMVSVIAEPKHKFSTSINA